MHTYTVAWLIDLSADTPEAAAREALHIMRDPGSTALVFTVTGPDGLSRVIDLAPEISWEET